MEKASKPTTEQLIQEYKKMVVRMANLKDVLAGQAEKLSPPDTQLAQSLRGSANILREKYGDSPENTSPLPSSKE